MYKIRVKPYKYCHKIRVKPYTQKKYLFKKVKKCSQVETYLQKLSIFVGSIRHKTKTKRYENKRIN
jgi:hypothetical protein